MNDRTPELTEVSDTNLWSDARAPEVRALLTRHLLGRRDSADVGQLVAALATVWAFWPSVSPGVGLGWLALVAIVAVLRSVNRRGLHDFEGTVEGERVLRAVRRDVLLSASVWALWTLILLGATTTELAFLLIILAGLVAAGTSTMVADIPSFVAFMALLLVPAGFVVAMSGSSRDHAALLLLVVVFGVFMVHVHRRAHAILVSQAQTRVKLEASERAAEANSRFLDTLVRSAASPIVVLNQGHFVLSVNPAFERVFGRSADEVRDRPLIDLVPEGEARDSVRALLASIGPDEPSSRELTLPDPDGGARRLRVSGATSDDPEQPMIVLVAEDITALVEAAAQEERARLAAEEAVQAKGSFLARMSHEIRTPMNGVLGMLELLSDTELNASQLRLVGAASVSGRSLMQVLNDVLDFSKLEAGRMSLESIPFDLSGVVADVARLNSPQAEARGLEIVVDDDADIPGSLVGDPGRIRQVLNNLVSNGVKFTERGYVKIVTKLEAHGEQTARVTIRVEDTGIGVPEDRAQKIFEEFTQADVSTTRRYGGTGLGLSISQSLVRQMGGELRIESAEGRGSSFSFELDLTIGDTRTRARPAEKLTGAKILVVDDNQTARAFTRAILERAGATVSTAPDGEGALASLRSACAGGSPFDGVILDSTLADIDGFELARELAGDESLEGTRILLLTSASEEDVAERARAVQIKGYLTKPVSGTELVGATQRLMGLRGRSEGPERRVVTRATMTDAPAVLRVLLVEDNAINQTIAKAMLSKRGHEIDLAENGVQAVEMVRAKPYDVVLMDLEMPEMGGVEATRIIRATEGLEGLKIVAVTAHSLPEERAKCAAVGMNGFLSKPFKSADLYRVVEE